MKVEGGQQKGTERIAPGSFLYLPSDF